MTPCERVVGPTKGQPFISLMHCDLQLHGIPAQSGSRHICMASYTKIHLFSQCSLFKVWVNMGSCVPVRTTSGVSLYFFTLFDTGFLVLGYIHQASWPVGGSLLSSPQLAIAQGC